MITISRASIDTLAHCALPNELDDSVVSSFTREQGAFPVVFFRNASISDSLVDLTLVIPWIRWMTCICSTRVWYII